MWQTKDQMEEVHLHTGWGTLWDPLEEVDNVVQDREQKFMCVSVTTHVMIHIWPWQFVCAELLWHHNDDSTSSAFQTSTMIMLKKILNLGWHGHHKTVENWRLIKEPLTWLRQMVAPRSAHTSGDPPREWISPSRLRDGPISSSYGRALCWRGCDVIEIRQHEWLELARPHCDRQTAHPITCQIIWKMHFLQYRLGWRNPRWRITYSPAGRVRLEYLQVSDEILNFFPCQLFLIQRRPWPPLR